MNENQVMKKEMTTEEIQEIIYKRVVEERKRNKGLDFEEAVKEVNTKIPA